MNRYIIIAAVILGMAAAAAFGVGFFFYSNMPPPQEQKEEQTPTTSKPTDTTPVTSQPVTSPSKSQSTEAVQAAYAEALAKGNVDNIKLYQTAISGTHALQVWRGDTVGGEALLRFDAVQNKWVIVDPGGGRWSVEGLVAAGVPHNDATALFSAMAR